MPVNYRECLHPNRTDIEYDPYRFYCLDCWEYFADFNDGKGFVFAWTLAPEERREIRKGMNEIVTIKHIRGGQPRPYADEEYESYITFSVPEGQLWGRNGWRKAEQVKPLVKLLVHGFAEEGRQWHESWLEKLEEVSPGRWHVIVKSPYLD